MNPLLSKFNEYKSITGYRFNYEIADGRHIEFQFKQTDFIHLLGLHKLQDIPIIQQYKDPSLTNIRAKYLISKIKHEQSLTDSTIKASSYFSNIKDRYNQFSRENLLSMSYTDIIIDFDPTILGSILSAKYILYEKKLSGGYNHLCIGVSSTRNYAESFFFQPTDRYIVGQKTLPVSKVTIFDNNSNIYFEDTLS